MRYKNGEPSLIKKKSFLLWYIGRNVEHALLKISDSSKVIQSRPKRAYTEISQLIEDEISQYLEMLNKVGSDDKEYINILFEDFRESYNDYLSLKSIL